MCGDDAGNDAGGSGDRRPPTEEQWHWARNFLGDHPGFRMPQLSGGSESPMSSGRTAEELPVPPHLQLTPPHLQLASPDLQSSPLHLQLRNPAQRDQTAAATDFQARLPVPQAAAQAFIEAWLGRHVTAAVAAAIDPAQADHWLDGVAAQLRNDALCTNALGAAEAGALSVEDIKLILSSRVRFPPSPPPAGPSARVDGPPVPAGNNDSPIDPGSNPAGGVRFPLLHRNAAAGVVVNPGDGAGVFGTIDLEPTSHPGPVRPFGGDPGGSDGSN